MLKTRENLSRIISRIRDRKRKYIRSDGQHGKIATARTRIWCTSREDREPLSCFPLNQTATAE